MKINDLRILLVGDSITEGFNVKTKLPDMNIINNGVSGDSTTETLLRIIPDWLNPEPDLIFICIGTNDFARDRADEFILKGIDLIICEFLKLTSNSKIVLTSIFPTRENPSRSNNRIIDFNNKLQRKSQKSRVIYFNLFKHFADLEGKLKKEYTEDGLHLNDEAYNCWAEKLFEFISFININ
jgi:lysophospholipase L1-like esterase